MPLTPFTQVAYELAMKTTVIELPPFERHRQNHLNDENFCEFQQMLMKNPKAGDVI
jgi:hypothetical protein